MTKNPMNVNFGVCLNLGSFTIGSSIFWIDYLYFDYLLLRMVLSQMVRPLLLTC